MTTRYTWRANEWRAAMQQAFDAGLTEAAMVCANRAVQLLNGPSPSAPGSPPGHDRGTLSQSIRYCSPQALGTPGKAAFGTATKYGRYLEFGAYVTPKRSKYLAVPVDRALAQKFRRSGVGSLRNIPGLKYIPPGRGAKHGGRLVVASSVKVHVRGAKKQSRTVAAGQTAFVLKKSVTIQPRPWIWRAANEARAEAAQAASRRAYEVAKASGLVT